MILFYRPVDVTVRVLWRASVVDTDLHSRTFLEVYEWINHLVWVANPVRL